VRLFTLLFALAGNFSRVFPLWRQDVLTGPKRNSILLSECGVASIDVVEETSLPEEGLMEQAALSLIDRVFMIALVVLALAVLT
jgi:membrane protein required for beta-lactamase induction